MKKSKNDWELRKRRLKAFPKSRCEGKSTKLVGKIFVSFLFRLEKTFTAFIQRKLALTGDVRT